MDFDRDVRVFQVIEAGLDACKEDAVFFEDAMDEDEILAAIERAQTNSVQPASEWKQKVCRCRSAYLYATFAFYGTDAKLRATVIAKDALKDLIVLFREREFDTARFERRLGQLREAIAVAIERGATQ
jgi:hypothetical protein